ncbi:MAG TPA: hypothetical protein EYP85_17045 [Armatimonadetes bacterium]|nr:hypothetical protein [Armatimonadota bacterium]
MRLWSGVQMGGRVLILAGLTLTAVWPSKAAEGPVEMRGVWMHAAKAKTPEEADALLDLAAQAHLNAVYLLVFYWGGHAYYHSDLAPFPQEVDPAFDPLAYMVRGAHERGMELHAWFVNGAYGRNEPGPIFAEHPNWAIRSALGQPRLWFDFGKPEVREFQRDLMLEVLRKYEVDGIHFDYIRYPGRGYCYCDYCLAEFRRRYGVDATQIAAQTLPTVAWLSGNPLVRPTTAQVLAQFEDGTPALLLNELGQGKVFLFNFHAEHRPLPVCTHILKNVLKAFSRPETTVRLWRSEYNAANYRYFGYEENLRWLRAIGVEPQPIADEELSQLEPKEVLLVPNVYRLTVESTEALRSFVKAGGRAIFIDGPVHAMDNPTMQELTGMAGVGEYFAGERIITPVGESPLVPCSEEAVNLTKFRRTRAQWDEFRRETVTLLVRDVYRRAKEIKPAAWVSAAVFYNRAAADGVLQDWYGWLEEGCIDYVIPMAYLNDNRRLEEALREWKEADPTLTRIVPGLSIFKRTPEGTTTKPTEQVLSQIALCREWGAQGMVLFSIHSLTSELQEALAQGPFAARATPYHPPPR